MKFSPALIIAVFAFLWSASQAAALPGRAEVKKVTGKATVAKGGGAAITLAEGMVLGTGDTIATGANSTVDLNLGLNGDVLRVEPDSTLLLDQLEVVSTGNVVVNTKLNVTKGDVTANVINKLSKASKYEVRTPGGVAGIRGTIYRASVGSGTSVIHGAVSWTPTGGASVNLYTGQGILPGAPAPVALALAFSSTIATSVSASTTATIPTQAANTLNTIAQSIATQAAYAVKQAGGTDAQAAAAAASAAQQAVKQVVAAIMVVFPNDATAISIAAAANQTIVAAAAVGAATGVAAGGGTAAAAAAAAQTALNTAAQATGTTVSTQTQTAILTVATTAATTTAAAVAGGGNALAAITSTVTTSAATTTQTVTTSTGTGGGGGVTVVANPLTASTPN